VQPGIARRPQRRDRPGAQLAVLGDQGPVEIARERVDLRWKVVGERQPPAACET
jgi:hypothetical protein